MTSILCQTPSTPKGLSEMWIACRNLYLDNHTQLNYIDKLISAYKKDEAAIYYTGNSYLSRTVNQACHTENLQWIYTFRAYISDLHKQLEAVDRLKQAKENNTPNFTVFCGKPLSASVLQQLIDNNGGLILMNGFLSTSKSVEVAGEYHGDEFISKGYKSILFQFCVNENIKRPYADISHCSTKRDEAEILFSFGTIWRIESIKFDQNPCVINLTSYSQLDTVLDHIMETYTSTDPTLLTLGDILHELGDSIQAEWFYHKMLEDNSLRNSTRIKLYYKIGMIRFEKHDYPVALDYLEKCSNLSKSSDHVLHKIGLAKPVYKYDNGISLIAIYNNIGFIHAQNKRFNDAVSYYQDALCVRGSDKELAVVNNNLGLLYYENGKYIKAYQHHLKALDFIGDGIYCGQSLKEILTVLISILLPKELRSFRSNGTNPDHSIIQYSIVDI